MTASQTQQARPEHSHLTQCVYTWSSSGHCVRTKWRGRSHDTRLAPADASRSQHTRFNMVGTEYAQVYAQCRIEHTTMCTVGMSDSAKQIGTAAMATAEPRWRCSCGATVVVYHSTSATSRTESMRPTARAAYRECVYTPSGISLVVCIPNPMMTISRMLVCSHRWLAHC